MTATGYLMLSATFAPALITAVLALSVEAFAGQKRGVDVAIGGLALSTAVATWAAVAFGRGLVADMLLIGGGSATIAAVVYGLGALSLLGGRSRLSCSQHGGQIAALVAFSSAAAVAVTASMDLGMLLIALEALALAGYALVSASRTRAADEAAAKYFVQGAVATGLLVFAIALFLGFHGDTGYIGLAVSLAGATTPGPAATALVLLAAALSFKIGAFPFHSWAPDAYQTARASVASYLSSAPKVAGLVALAVFGSTALSQSGASWALPMTLLAVASIVFGNLAALRQGSFQRLLAYSGIAQVGYALVGMSSTAAAAFPVMVFSVTYAVAVAGAYLFAEAVHQAEDWDGQVASLAGIGKRRPLLAAGLSVSLLSMVGLPLSAGFWGKFLVFASAVSEGMTWLAIVGVIGSVVSFGYYGRILRTVYFEEGLPAENPSPPAASAALAVTLCALAVLALGIAPFFAGLEWVSAVLS